MLIEFLPGSSLFLSSQEFRPPRASQAKVYSEETLLSREPVPLLLALLMNGRPPVLVGCFNVKQQLYFHVCKSKQAQPERKRTTNCHFRPSSAQETR